MKKSSLLFCTTLSCILFSGLGVASAVANSSDKNLPKPVVVVAPDNMPRNYVNTTVRIGMTLDENGYPNDDDRRGSDQDSQHYDDSDRGSRDGGEKNRGNRSGNSRRR